MRTNYYLSRISTRGSVYGSRDILIIIKRSSNRSITWRSEGVRLELLDLLKNKSI
jgi:hypothetical protein